MTIDDEPTASTVVVTVDTASISTLFAARDEDLRSDRFLDAATHPTMNLPLSSVSSPN